MVYELVCIRYAVNIKSATDRGSWELKICFNSRMQSLLGMGTLIRDYKASVND